MLPGYVSNDEFYPYLSPIYICSVQPLKSGNGLLRLEFINAAYAQGVRDTDITLRVLMRGSSYMFSELLAAQGTSMQSAVIGELNFDWLHRQWLALDFQEDMAEPYRSDPQAYLDRRIRGKTDSPA
jgi:hypothetical protein